MLSAKLKKLVKTYPDFPKKGINFRDLLPVFAHPKIYSELIETMASHSMYDEADAIIAIDARGFLLASCIAIKTMKPMVVARKPGKLPGNLLSESYDLEYGNNCLSIQKDSVQNYDKFVIVDDLLATGGTVQCVSNILTSIGKEITGLSVVIELSHLSGKSKINFPVSQQLIL